MAKFADLFVKNSSSAPSVDQFRHPEQLPLALPQKEDSLIVVVSGYLGAGKTSLMGGLTTAIEKVPTQDKAIIVNDLVTRIGSLDVHALSSEGIKVIELTACGCCDAKPETIKVAGEVLEQKARFIIYETGGETNGSQAALAIAEEAVRHSSSARIVHVTLVDAENFRDQVLSNHHVITDLNLETANIVVITKATAVNRAGIGFVKEYIDALFANSDLAKPHIIESGKPSLIEPILWSAICDSEGFSTRTLFNEDQRATRLKRKKNLTSNTVPNAIALYSEYSQYLGDQESVKHFLTSILEKLPADLRAKVVRIKGEFPLGSGEQVRVNCYPHAEGITVGVGPRQPQRFTQPVLTLFTETSEPIPHLFAFLGIPIEFHPEAVRRAKHEILQSKEAAAERLLLKAKVALRGDSDKYYELVEKLFLHQHFSEESEALPNQDPKFFGYSVPFSQQERSPENIEVTASESINNAFRILFPAIVDQRLTLLEALKKQIELNGDMPPNAPQLALSYGYDLLRAQQLLEQVTHQGKTLPGAGQAAAAEFYTQFSQDFEPLYERILAVRPGLLMLDIGLKDPRQFGFRGRADLTNETLVGLQAAAFYSVQEAQRAGRNKAEVVTAFRTGIDLLVQVARQREAAGWEESRVTLLHNYINQLAEAE